MVFKNITFSVALTLMASVAQAQTQTLTRTANIQLASGEITSLGEYCDDSANSDDESCIILATGGGVPVTNFLPIVGAAGLGAVFLGALGGGGGGGTPSTTN